jgi:hypothetical protein
MQLTGNRREMPAEIQEQILKILLPIEDKYNLHILLTKTDLRWLSNHRTTVQLLRTSSTDIKRSDTKRFFEDVLAFEKVVCQCGIQDISNPRTRYLTIRHHRHITFCNIGHLCVGFVYAEKLSTEMVEKVFQCLKTLTDLEVHCADTQLNMVATVATWSSHVPTLDTIRFVSEDGVSTTYDSSCRTC